MRRRCVFCLVLASVLFSPSCYCEGVTFTALEVDEMKSICQSLKNLNESNLIQLSELQTELNSWKETSSQQMNAIEDLKSSLAEQKKEAEQQKVKAGFIGLAAGFIMGLTVGITASALF